jgi:hypothetical protein
MSVIDRLRKAQTDLTQASSELLTELHTLKNPIGPPPVDLARSLCRLLLDVLGSDSPPIPMIFCCPSCGARHIDEGPWAEKPHHTHSCQECGFTWRLAVVNTVGVRFLPGFKNEDT